MLFDIGKLFM